MVVELAAGVTTALINSKSDSPGLALAEVYDASGEAPGAGRLVNLSTRGTVSTGDAVMIAGFVIRGNLPAKVLLRGVGPGSGRDPRKRLQDFVIVSRDDQYQTQSKLSILT